MKTSYIFLAVIAVIMYNGVIMRKDRTIVEAYNKVCAELPKSNPNCRYAK